MREIIFRGKRTDNREWVFGSLWLDDYQIKECESVSISWWSDDKTVWNREEVDPDTVGQYTGLTKNGKKIFEGDILYVTALGNDHHQKRARTVAVVENYMGNTCLCLYGEPSGITLYSILIDHIVEIIGNIHDNPELLKGGETDV